MTIIKKLEKAEGPSKALNREIARAVGWHRVEPRHAGNKNGGWIAPEDFNGCYSDGAPIYDGMHGTTIAADVPNFTGSLDAAMALAPDAHTVLVMLNQGFHAFGMYYQSLERRDDPKLSISLWPAIRAALIAALRARGG